MKIQKVLLSGLMISLMGCAQLAPKEEAEKPVVAKASKKHTFAMKKAANPGAGTQLKAPVSGMLMASMTHSASGKRVSDSDKAMMQQAAQNALANRFNNQVEGWTNPNSGNSGNFVVYDTRTSKDQVCRDYVNVIIVNGISERVAGRACKPKSGSDAWH